MYWYWFLFSLWLIWFWFKQYFIRIGKQNTNSIQIPFLKVWLCTVFSFIHWDQCFKWAGVSRMYWHKINAVYFTKSVGVPMTMLSNIIVYVHTKNAFNAFQVYVASLSALWHCSVLPRWSIRPRGMTRYPIPVRINGVDLLLCFIEDLF